MLEILKSSLHKCKSYQIFKSLIIDSIKSHRSATKEMVVTTLFMLIIAILKHTFLWKFGFLSVHNSVKKFNKLMSFYNFQSIEYTLNFAFELLIILKFKISEFAFIEWTQWNLIN